MSEQSIFPAIRLRVAANDVSLHIGGKKLSLSATTSRNVVTDGPAPNYRDIRSAEIAQLTGEASRTIHQLLTTERATRKRRDNDIAVARTNAVEAYAAFAEWNDGVFLKHVRPARFRELTASVENANRRLEALLDEQERALLISDIDADPEIIAVFDALRTAFQAVAQSTAIWDTLSEQRTNQVAERTSATHSVTRTPVKFNVVNNAVIFRNWTVPRLANANGGDLHVYPGCILYRISDEAFALIDVRDVTLNVRSQRVQEPDVLPHDAKQVGQTWSKVNKDGSPDRRFTANRQIPIVEYAELTLTSPSGLNEQYLISNYGAATAFAEAWTKYQRTIDTRS